jgi:hypothetical protein
LELLPECRVVLRRMATSRAVARRLSTVAIIENPALPAEA